jgi:hypothetical protein
MLVLSNRALGPRAELIVSDAVLSDLLRAVARAAAPNATARWELELVDWLDARAGVASSVDVGDLAWTPEHFDDQRAFVLAAIDRARETSNHAAALARWSSMIAAHPRDAVAWGRRWRWTGEQHAVTSG